MVWVVTLADILRQRFEGRYTVSVFTGREHGPCVAEQSRAEHPWTRAVLAKSIVMQW